MKIFLDTNILLNSFAKFLNDSKLSIYANSNYTLYSFEKCKYECYMAFRGVGGKKPDEGRGDWASRHLKNESYPAQLSKLASKYFDGNTTFAAYSINHIEEEYYAYDKTLLKYIDKSQHKEFLKQLKKIEILYSEKYKFENLIDIFNNFLEMNSINILYYHEIFSLEKTQSIIHFDEFCKNTVIPSEDLEIIYSALITRVDIFLTTDRKLKKLLASLGQNLPLHYNQVILEEEFESFIKN